MQIGLTNVHLTGLQVNLGSFNLNNVNVKAIDEQKESFNKYIPNVRIKFFISESKYYIIYLDSNNK